MQKGAGRVALASALGAGIGTLIALNARHHLWWVGALMGAVIGYVAYDPGGFVRAIPSAWRAARRCELSDEAMEWWKIASVKVMIILAWMFVFFLIANSEDWVIILFCFGMTAVFVPIVTACFAFICSESILMPDEEQETVWGVLYAYSPPTVLCYRLPRAMIRYAPAVWSWCKDFGWELFVRVHSERRLLCAADACLGAAIGFFAGSALIGTCAGGLLGFINYALVTERWLRPKGYLIK